MPYRLTELGLLVLSKPEDAKKKILKAFKQNGANLPHAAKALGISLSSLNRHVENLGIKKEVDAIRDKARKDGWIQSDRWPEKAS